MRGAFPLPLALSLGLVLVLLGLLGYQQLSRARAERLEVYGPAPAYTLIDQHGRPVSSEAFAGKVVLANFIYTHCIDICPLLSVRMQGMQEALRQEGVLGSKAQLLSFTTDPARDTPAVLRDYAERHQADPEAWRFLTGPEDTVVPLIVKGFYQAVQALPTPAAGLAGDEQQEGDAPAYEVMHSGRFVLIDRQGRMRAFYSGTEFDQAVVVRDMQALLRE